MPKSSLSAGLLLFRRCSGGGVEVLLVHPGGPYFRGKDDGWWTIPKGEPEEGEELISCAQREFREETGLAPAGPWLPLSPVRQKGGKRVHAWGVEGDCDPARIVSKTFTLEWPPKSGQRKEFPEVDRAGFFDLATARRKINPAQSAWIDELERLLSAG